VRAAVLVCGTHKTYTLYLSIVLVEEAFCNRTRCARRGGESSLLKGGFFKAFVSKIAGIFIGISLFNPYVLS